MSLPGAEESDCPCSEGATQTSVPNVNRPGPSQQPAPSDAGNRRGSILRSSTGSQAGRAPHITVTAPSDTSDISGIAPLPSSFYDAGPSRGAMRTDISGVAPLTWGDANTDPVLRRMIEEDEARRRAQGAQQRPTTTPFIPGAQGPSQPSPGPSQAGPGIFRAAPGPSQASPGPSQAGAAPFQAVPGPSRPPPGPSKQGTPRVSRLAIPKYANRPAQVGPQLVKSSVTTTTRTTDTEPATKTVTTTKKTTQVPSRPQIPSHFITSTPIPGQRIAPRGIDPSPLVASLERNLMRKSVATGAPARVSGTRTSGLPRSRPPTIMTSRGPVPVSTQMTLERKVEKSERGEHVSELMTGIKHREGKKLEMNVQYLDPSAALPVTTARSSEVVIVKSSVSTAGDVIQTVRSVIHEKTGPEPPDPKRVSKLIDEENANIDEGLRMLAQQSKAAAKSQKKPPADDAPEDLQPEMLAAIMHTEEQGLAMAAPPTQLYELLFPEGGPASSIPVSSVVPAPLQDIVVPEEILELGLTNEELNKTLAAANQILQEIQNKPTDCKYAEAIENFELQSPKSPQLPKLKKKRVKPVGEEKPPWGDADFQPIADLVGAAAPPPPAATSGFQIPPTQPPQQMFPGDTGGLEYILVPQPPSHISRVQLRGSIKPSWFPGFYVALPERGRGIQLASSPGSVLAAAWKEVKPSSFGEDSFVIG